MCGVPLITVQKRNFIHSIWCNWTILRRKYIFSFPSHVLWLLLLEIRFMEFHDEQKALLVADANGTGLGLVKTPGPRRNSLGGQFDERYSATVVADGVS